MRDDDSFVGYVFTLIAVVVAFVIGGCSGVSSTRKEAVKAGVAEWRATPEGDVTFHWKEPKK